MLLEWLWFMLTFILEKCGRLVAWIPIQEGDSDISEDVADEMGLEPGKLGYPVTGWDAVSYHDLKACGMENEGFVGRPRVCSLKASFEAGQVPIRKQPAR